MSLAQAEVPGKANHRLRPTKNEGLYIQFRVKSNGIYLSGLARNIGVRKSIVHDVVFGRRRSARVEAEIVRTLEKTDWNEVVLEARSAVSGKPVITIIEEEKIRLLARNKRQKEEREAAITAMRNRRKAG